MKLSFLRLTKSSNYLTYIQCSSRACNSKQIKENLSIKDLLSRIKQNHFYIIQNNHTTEYLKEVIK